MEQTALEALEVICKSSNDINKELRKNVIIRDLTALEIIKTKPTQFTMFSFMVKKVGVKALNYSSDAQMTLSSIAFSNREEMMTEEEFNILKAMY